MFFGVSHVVIPVSDLERAERFWTDVFGFQPVKRAPGFVDVDCGSMALRLMRTEHVIHHAAVRISTGDVAASHAALVAAGARDLHGPKRNAALELEAAVSDPDGHTLIVWRELTEDEYGFTPALPKEGEWQPDAEALLIDLLAYVPALFRALARRKVTRVVEELADQDKSPITRRHVIRGYIMASAKVTRYRLVEPLRKCGIDPDQYREEFEA